VEELEEVTTSVTAMITEAATTTVTTADLSKLSEIDVDLLNSFLYIATSFIMACLFWFTVKLIYRLFNLFF
jgi:hypothetical protein